MGEQPYIEFIYRTRLGAIVLAGVVAFLFLLLVLGPQHFAIAYTVGLFLPLAAAAWSHRDDFAVLSRGAEITWRKTIILGIAPISVFLVLFLALVYNLHMSYHSPITTYVAPVVEGFSKSQNWVLLEIPFVEEVIFRLWLQTRLQQYLGAFGAILACVLFLAVHLTLSPWRIVVAALLTLIRYRYGSLGATVLAHYTYDLGVWLFVAYAR